MKTTVLLFLLALSFRSYSQQYNNWVFGYGAGLSFSNVGAPVSFSNVAMIANEGSSSISNEKDSLLFYTDGQTVYNRKHEVMQNGTGLLGHPSAFQNSIIVQQPANDSLYYLFTTDAIENNFQNGYRYSVINLKKDGGFGAVVQKNVLLAPDATERLTAVRHANGIDVWIIGNATNSDKFYVWLLTCTGVQPAVISSAGDVMNIHPRMNIGSLKTSPDGKMLCQTHFPDDVQGARTFVQLFDFDNSTGIISNARKLSLPALNPYTCEFSPGSAFLYLPDPETPYFGQVEAKLGSSAAIVSSLQIIPASLGFYGIQAAADGKIYLTRSINVLSTIASPDAKGLACTFQKDNFPLQKQSGIGLPAVLNELSPDPNGFSFQVLDSCNGRLQFNGFATNPAQTQWEWDFDDGTSSNLQSPQHSFANVNQTYWVTLKIKPANACGYILKSKEILPAGYYADANFNYDAKCDSAFVRFTNTSVYNGNVNFQWDFGDGNGDTVASPVHAFANAGMYTVSLNILTPSKCISGSIRKNIVLQQPSVNVRASKLEIMETESVKLSVVGNFVNVQWSPPETIKDPQAFTTTASPYQDITYYAEVHNADGCLARDSVHIKVNKLNDVFVPTAFTPNGDGLNETFAPWFGHGYTLKTFSVFNRWGMKVFETKTKGTGWDGSFNGVRQATGTYVWTLQVAGPSGKTRQMKGTVTLLR